MQVTRFPDGTAVSALGQGTWMMAERPDQRAQEIAALCEGTDLGMTVIDTAEICADGGADRLVAEAIRGRRDKVFLVSKAYPHNASLELLPEACEASLRCSGTDNLDLYLLHWRGTVPLAETVEAMELLVANGRIARWGVSNLDTVDMAEMVSAGGEACATNETLYNLNRQGRNMNSFRGSQSDRSRSWPTVPSSRDGFWSTRRSPYHASHRRFGRADCAGLAAAPG